jgi:hypothetical protein
MSYTVFVTKFRAQYLASRKAQELRGVSVFYKAQFLAQFRAENRVSMSSAFRLEAFYGRLVADRCINEMIEPNAPVMFEWRD